MDKNKLTVDLTKLIEGERVEMLKLGVLTENNLINGYNYPAIHSNRPPVEKFAVHAPKVINEAYGYSGPSSFTRALSLEFGGYKVLLISGTPSVNEEGKAEHIGDFNKIRTSFFSWMNLDPLPASAGIQARLCRETLLIEIETYAVCKIDK
ncbi:MAG: hypothetical protein WAW07_16260 [Bacteroidales bacterium]